MIFDVKGTAKVKHYCDCEYCAITQEDVEVDARVIAVDENAAMRKALSETINWVKWKEAPTVTKVAVPFVNYPDAILRTFNGFVTDGFIAVKLELSEIGDMETKEVTNIPIELTEAKRKVHLTYSDKDDSNAVVYVSEDGTRVYINELYHEAVRGLGVDVYSTTDPVQPGSPYVLVDRGEIVGFVMPMHRGRDG